MAAFSGRLDIVNPDLGRLQAYPFEKLKALYATVTPDLAYSLIPLYIGEPKHPTPEFIKQALTANLGGLAGYPLTLGQPELRGAIAGWLKRRYGLPAIDPETQILPVMGTREALFAIAQVVVDRTRPGATVISPNPFYQIYEGAALLAGAEPVYLNTPATTHIPTDFKAIPDAIWKRVQLFYTCSPSNPGGRVMPLAEWKQLFELADRHDFYIASDECYSELYFDESRPPLGGLQAAHMLGRPDFKRLIMFSSLSKRSNVPGMRSGFVAGDAGLMKYFLLYRTYHGNAMSGTIQAASIAAWNDEVHVRENRRLYVEKYKAVLPLIVAPLETAMPEGVFYLWIKTPGSDVDFARELYRRFNVSVLPGSYLAREASGGGNPGTNYIRIALVAPLAECVEAARRIGECAKALYSRQAE